MRVAWARGQALIGVAAAGLASSAAQLSADTAKDELKNPYLEQKEAIEEGKQIYRSKCIMCHGRMGGRGPNLFKTKLTDEQFLEVVLNGREGTLMPVFGYRMSPGDVWKVHSFVKSRESY